VPVILDGAQGAGAVPVDVQALGCVAYAAAGQKWLCGADGTGFLYLQDEFGERVRTVAPTYFSFEDTSKGLDSALRPGARRLDTPLSREVLATSVAALQLLEAEGFETIVERAADLAERFVAALEERGRTVAARDRSTLIAFEDPDPETTRQALLEKGIAVRNLPGHPYLRASVGAWNDESDLERLLAALG
jgi:L-cysteine/cystine lyase